MGDQDVRRPVSWRHKETFDFRLGNPEIAPPALFFEELRKAVNNSRKDCINTHRWRGTQGQGRLWQAP